MYPGTVPSAGQEVAHRPLTLSHPAWAGLEVNGGESGGRGRGRGRGRREGGGGGGTDIKGFTFSRDLKLLKGKFAKLIALLIR